MAFDPDRTVAALLAARARPRRTLGRLADGPGTFEDGVAAQAALARHVGAWPPAGFKVGATAPVMQAYLGLPGPIAGFMAEGGLHGNGSTLGLGGFFRPGVECEIAVVLARDLPPGPCTPEQAAAAVGELMAGIEVVEDRYGDLAAVGTPALVADQVFHAAAVLGAPCAGWRSLDLRALQGRIAVNGVVRGEGRSDALLGDPMAALAWLAASPEAAAFGGLRAGQAAMLGSVTPPIWLDGPAEVRVEFACLPPVTLSLV